MQQLEDLTILHLSSSLCTRPRTIYEEELVEHMPRFIVGDIDGNLGLVARNRLYFNPLRTQRRFLPGTNMLKVKWTPETNPYIRRDLTEKGTMRLLGIDAKAPEEKIAEMIRNKNALREFVLACAEPRAAYHALKPLLCEKFKVPEYEELTNGD